MNNSTNSQTSRRDFIKTTGRLAAVSALAGMAIPHVHAASGDTIQVALVGCGGRGGGAARNALSTSHGPVKLVAMADVFEDRLRGALEGIKNEHGAKVEVPADRQFIGFDGYQKAMDCLKPGDIVILTTPPAFRWVHFTYAIKKGLNVFMEKPVTVDGPTSKRMLGLAEEASKKNLKVGVGLMSRHSRALQELHKRVEDGEIGDVILMRGYRMHGPVGTAFSTKWPGNPAEVMWQIKRFHSFLWASGGCYSDFYIHHIDHLCWMKNAWPVKAQGIGGRHYRTDPEGQTYIDQNFDSYSVEYTFPDGGKMYMDGRCVNGCNDIYSSYAHGSKGLAIVSKSSDCGGPSSIFKGQNMQRSNMLWSSKPIPGQDDPYLNEWNDLMEAIRADKPYNEAKRGVEASLVTSMGRMAAHTGLEITYEDILNGDHEFAPGVDKLTMDGPAPLVAKDGKYPIPTPGRNKHEY
ncbi:MAG: Gfo/Idh/MocA family oxidoreductase [Verrucomicrobia bacterium]|jgi:predicted dehydrogenase|nr:Gfo/Idh/MocA family oxidoreductase [Verrucomicrobiota bacterium]